MMILIYKFFILFIAFFFTYPVYVYSSMNFEGAIIDYKDVPTNAWRYGVFGNKWIVLIVNDKSLAKQIGLKQGDIIISLDDKDVVSINDLIKLPVGKHNIKVINKKYQIEDLVINIIPNKNETYRQNDLDSKSPPIVVNDDVLSSKYGKSEVINKNKKRSYQECMDDELANGSTYEYYINKPNSRGGDYGRAQRICDEEFGNRSGIKIERFY